VCTYTTVSGLKVFDAVLLFLAANKI